MTVKPTQFMKSAREQLASAMDARSADAFINMLKTDKTDWLQSFLCMPGFIPAKYHDRMQRAWCAAVARILFEKSSRKLSYAERFKLAQRIK